MAGKALIDTGRQTVEIIQETRYPWEEGEDDRQPTKGARHFNLLIRIPGGPGERSCPAICTVISTIRT
jgi:DUF1680 family protein